MNSTEIIAMLALKNPWWRGKEFINQDPHLIRASNSGFKWTPHVLRPVDLRDSAIYTLRGIRQVGKTTLLKQLIRELLVSVESPYQLIYVPCEPFRDRMELRNALSTVISWARRLSRNDRIYLFMDEVTLIKNWGLAIKELVDDAFLKNVVVVATGSSAIDVLQGGEQLPGRRGDYISPPDRILYPMLFDEYVRVRGLSLNIDFNDIIQLVDHMLIYENELRQLFYDYTITGGFPRALTEYLKNNFSITDAPIRDLIFYISQDMRKINLNEDTVKLILMKVLKRVGQPISYTTIARECNIDPKTAERYVTVLRHLFILDHATFIDVSLSPVIRKRKKYFLVDPLMFHFIRYWNAIPETPANEIVQESIIDLRPQLLENIVLTHLHRTFANVFYWRSKRGHEIDVISLSSPDVVFFAEVKVSPKASDLSRLSFLSQKFRTRKRYTILVGDIDTPPRVISDAKAILPVHMFLVLLKFYKKHVSRSV